MKKSFSSTFLGTVLVLIATSQLAGADDVLCKNQTSGEIKVRQTSCSASEVKVELREADESMVARCTYLGDLHATSGWGNLAASKGINNAKKSVMVQAAKKEATHIVWGTVVGGYSPSVTAKAYKRASSSEEEKKKKSQMP